MAIIQVKNLSKTFKVKLKEKGLKGSIKSMFKPRYKYVRAVNNISFEVEKGEIIAEIGTNLMTNFATYPDGIFKGAVRIILYTIVPVGFANYIPIQVLTEFNLGEMLAVIGVTILFVTLAFLVFYRGLKRYSSSNLMIARI